MKLVISKFFQSNKSHYLIVASVACAVMLPILFKGIPFGYDLPHHFQCAFSFYEGIIAGDFYPSWSANRNYGFGGMELRLYPPISHYSLALFYLIAQDWHLATWLTVTFYSIVGSFGVYFWARELMPSSQAVFAGCVYALMPYHLTQIYNTFFYAEYVGSAVLPFSFWFIYRVCKRGRPSDVLGLAISFAALLLTHLPLTVIGAICFSIYGLSLLRKEKLISQIIKLSGGAALGLAASSFFWIKVIQERDLLAKTLNYSDPWLDYRLHFLLTPIQNLIGELQTRIYETSAFFYDLMLFYAVLLTLAFTVPFMIRAKDKFTELQGVWLIFLASVFLAVPFSRLVWDVLPLLQEVQFPWRWLSVVSLCGSVLAASRLNILFDWFKNKKRPLALIISGCFFAFAAFSTSQIIRQAPFIPVSETVLTMENTRTDKGFTFWWTIWTKEEVFKVKDKILVANRSVHIKKWTATEKDFQISAGEAEYVRIAVFYHPNWEAKINGTTVETKPDESGAMRISLPKNSSSVKI